MWRVSTTQSTLIAILGEGGGGNRGLVGLMQVTCLPTWSIKSLTHGEASRGIEHKAPTHEQAQRSEGSYHVFV